MPDDLAREMAQAGMFRLLVPKCYQGLEVHPQEFFDALVTTSEADGAVGWCQMIGVTTGMMAASLPQNWSEAMYAANPDTVTTGVTAPMGRAVREGNTGPRSPLACSTATTSSMWPSPPAALPLPRLKKVH